MFKAILIDVHININYCQIFVLGFKEMKTEHNYIKHVLFLFLLTLFYYIQYRNRIHYFQLKYINRLTKYEYIT